MTESLRRCIAACAMMLAGAGATAQARTPDQQLAFDIYKELVEINTVTTTGDTAKAADAMAARLLAAGFTPADVRVLKPAPRKGNLVARLRGTGARRPMLVMAHIDVVDAKREDWSTDPFKLVEKDGYYYARGTGDDKYMAAAFVTNLIRYKREGFAPDRDIIVLLETDEETDALLGVRWMLANHRELIDAEFAINEGADVGLKDGKPIRIGLQTSEKVYVDYTLEVTNAGGHSATPRKDNAIYRLAKGLAKLSAYEFPVKLNETTKAWLEKASVFEDARTGAAMRTIAANPQDEAAVAVLRAKPNYDAQLRTTCVATMLTAGHAPNALPQLARANVNCRVLPGEPLDEVQKTIERVIGDENIRVKAGEATPSPPSPLRPELVRTIESVAKDFWPGAPLIPIMASGATDGAFLRNAGIPTYGHGGNSHEVDEPSRAHGRDERIAIKAFYDGNEYLYRLVKALAAGK